MKLFALILTLSLTLMASAQEKMNKVAVNPIQLFGYNRINIEIERGFNEGKYGITLYLGSTGNASRIIHDQYSRLSEQNASIKFYAKTIDKSCFWYGGMVTVSSGNLYSRNGTDSSINIGALGLQITGGYQIILQSFYINLYAGTGYSLTNNLFGSAVFSDRWGEPSHFIFTYGVKMGYAF